MDDRLTSILGYFEPTVLAAYREQPDKYTIHTDYFEGQVSITSEYFARFDENTQDDEYIDVQFGYRTLKNGELKVAAYLPDLIDKSHKHVDRWRPFIVATDDWLEDDQDERFSLWVRRYLKGDWDVENGPAFYVLEELKLINGLSAEAVARRLFSVDDTGIPYPAAQNTHRYEDAHRDLYRIVVDGLEKDGIERLGRRLGHPVNAQSSRTRDALAKVLPTVAEDPRFADPIENISAQRRLASHKVRPPATAMRAFEQFTTDLRSCRQALRLLRTTLESELHMDAKKAMIRQDALRHLPRIGRPAEGNYSISGAARMVGKTVDRIEFGFREDIEGAHQSELLLIYFSDGSIMSIDTGCNARNPSDRAHDAQDFHVDFRIHWVPPKV